jgi:hypothetical protein
MKKIYSDGQILTLNEKDEVVDIQYDQSEGGRAWAEFDRLNKEMADKDKSDSNK